MRKTPLVLAVLLLAAATAHAQPPTFTEPYQVRGAVGDIPTTALVEPANAWNLEQWLAWPFTNGSSEDDRTLHFAIPAGATLENVTCECRDFRFTATARSVTITIGNLSDPGVANVRVLTSQPFDSTLGFSLTAPFEAGAHQAVILYVPMGSEVDAPVALSSPGASTDGRATIQFARFDDANPRPTDLWFAIHPETQAAAAAPAFNDDLVWVFLALGVVAGAALWAVLVSRGVVQTKSRKQVVATAAHVEAAATDPPAVLEGKKRALMAALKDIELARQANEMPVDVYDAVKADLKKQAVTVMRALEAGNAEPKA